MRFQDSVYLDFAIQTLCPNAEYTFNDADYSTVTWLKLDIPAPTQDEINVVVQQIKDNEIALTNQKATQRQAILDRLGLTAEEAALLLGAN